MNADWQTQKLGKNHLKLFTILILVLVIIHGLFNDFFKVDNTSILLLLILILLPYLPLIKKIKFGDFEAEISNEEIKNIEKKVEEIPEKQHEKIKSKKVENLKELAESDPTLALARARIEIEKKIRSLGQIYLKEKTVNSRSLRGVINELMASGIMEPSLVALLNDVISVANRAIHGESVSKGNAIKLVKLGNKAMDELDYVVIERALKSESSEVITTHDMENFMEGDYILKTVVPYVKNPEFRTYHLNQAELDAFLEGYDEIAEFIVSLERKK